MNTEKLNNILILGGGVTGLACALQIAKKGFAKIVVLEKAEEFGGVCRTIHVGEHWADLGPHKIFSLLPGVVEETLSIFKEDEIIKHKKKNSIFLRGHYLDYPISLGNVFKLLGPYTCAKAALNLIFTKIVYLFRHTQEISYEDYIIRRFGKDLYKLIFCPLAQKIWGNPGKLSADIAATRIPSTNVFNVLLEAVGLRKVTDKSSAKYFYYPKKGFGQISEKMEQILGSSGAKLVNNVSNINLQFDSGRIRKAVWQCNNKTENMDVDLVISTIPFKEVVNFVSGVDLKSIGEQTARLKFRNVILVYLFFDTPQLLNDHWIFVPDPDIIFNRIYEPKMLSKELSPSDKTVICCDLTVDENSVTWEMSDNDLSKKCLDGLIKMRIIDKQSSSGFKVVRIKDFYPCYGIEYKEALFSVINKLNDISNLVCVGRLGLYHYSNYDHCMYMAMLIANMLDSGLSPGKINLNLLNETLSFKIVD